MEIAVNIKPLQCPTDPLNEVIAAALQASSKEALATVPTYYSPLQGIAFRKRNEDCGGHLQGWTVNGSETRTFNLKRLELWMIYGTHVRICVCVIAKLRMFLPNLLEISPH